MADPVERYLELALRLGRHDADLIDAYYGPDELSRRVEAEEPREPAALAEDADALAEEVAGDEWLAAQVGALGANARKLGGERLDYAEEGRLVYGIEPRWHDEEPFRLAAAILEEVLPGEGDVRERYARWFAETAIPAELVEQAVLDAAAELRRLTCEAIGLPEGEEFELELVTGERWLGYARYLGGLRTKIQVNTDLPLPAADLVPLTSHEIYGGHHTHRVWQETELVRGRGELERTLDVLWSPEAVISEGVAMTGPDAARRRRAAARGGGARPARLRLRCRVGSRVDEARDCSCRSRRTWRCCSTTAAPRPKRLATTPLRGRSSPTTAWPSRSTRSCRIPRRRTSTPTGRAASSSRRMSPATRSASARC